MKNEYIPYPAVIEAIQIESFDTKTLKIHFKDKNLANSFVYKPGQFVQMSIFGVGEAPISITSSPSRKGFLEFTIRAVGKVTRAIHKLKVNDTIYLRGPYGNSFPFQELSTEAGSASGGRGKDLYFIAGGIGLPPLRSVINLVLDKRKNFAKVKILYGAKTPDELCFKQELKAWGKIPDTEVLLTVDVPDESWKGDVGVVTTLWDKTDMSTSCGIAYVCGPLIMIKFVIQKLLGSGFNQGDIYMSLERYMKCGIGKCGHCNIGDKFVCTDGPVFSFSQIRELPDRERPI